KPVQRHQQRTANADQKIDVRDAPYPPRGPAAKVQARELDDGSAPTDGREVARVTVAEGPGAPRLRPRADAVRDDAGDISSRLLGCRRDAGHRRAVGCPRKRGITDDEDVRMTGYRQVRLDDDSARAVGFRAEPARGGRRGDARSPDHRS